MFRIIANCSEFDCDKLIERLFDMVKQMDEQGMLDKLPGGMKLPPFVNAKMLTMLPGPQKLALISKGLTQEKGRMLPVLQRLLGGVLGNVSIRDFDIQTEVAPDALVQFRLDVAKLDADQAIDLLIANVMQEKDIPEILGEHYDAQLSMENIGFYMHGQPEETKEYLVVRTMSVGRAKLMAYLEKMAQTQEVQMKISSMKFMIKETE